MTTPDPKAYRCASPTCPGFPYKASERGHPPDVCGADASAQRVRAIAEGLTVAQLAYLGGDARAVKHVQDLDELVAQRLAEYDPFAGHAYPIPTPLGRAAAKVRRDE